MSTCTILRVSVGWSAEYGDSNAIVGAAERACGSGFPLACGGAPSLLFLLRSGEFKSSSAYRTHARIALPPRAEAPSSGLTLGRTISSLGTFWKRAASGLNSGVSMNWR